MLHSYEKPTPQHITEQTQISQCSNLDSLFLFQHFKQGERRDMKAFIVFNQWSVRKRTKPMQRESKIGKNGGKEASGVAQISQPSLTFPWANQNKPSVSCLHCQTLCCLSPCPGSSTYPSTLVFLTFKHTHARAHTEFAQILHMPACSKMHSYSLADTSTERHTSSPPLTLPVSTLKSW